MAAPTASATSRASPQLETSLHLLQLQVATRTAAQHAQSSSLASQPAPYAAVASVAAPPSSATNRPSMPTGRQQKWTGKVGQSASVPKSGKQSANGTTKAQSTSPEAPPGSCRYKTFQSKTRDRYECNCDEARRRRPGCCVARGPRTARLRSF